MAESQAFAGVTQQDLRELLADRDGPAISLYQPTHRAGPETEQNVIRLKNLVQEIEDRAIARGFDRTTVCKLRAPIQGLLDRGEFWRHQLDGLAVFSAPDYFRYFKLPYSVEELVIVSNSVHTTPLMPALSEGHFYVLAISQGSLRLVRATQFGAEEVDLSGLDIPRSFDEAMRFDDFQKSNLQRHPTSSPGRGGGRVMQHGHGPGDEERKVEILRYFKAVDGGISKLLAGETAALVIAAVDYLIPLYRQAAAHPNVLEKGVSGNPEQLSPTELQARAWPVVEPHFRAVIERAKDRFGSGLGPGTASCEPATVLAAAHAGRIETLLVATGNRLWGIFDPATNEVRDQDEPGPADVDLVDLATRQTVLHGGNVYVVEPDAMPCEDAMAAVFRF